MKTFIGWVLVILGLLLLSWAGLNWKAYVYEHYRGGQMSLRDWAFLCGTFLPGLLLILVGYPLSSKR